MVGTIFTKYWYIIDAVGRERKSVLKQKNTHRKHLRSRWLLIISDVPKANKDELIENSAMIKHK